MRAAREEVAGRSNTARRVNGSRRLLSFLLVALLVLGSAVWSTACTGDEESSDPTSSTTENGAAPSGDIDGTIGEEIAVGDALVTVRALEPTFNPIAPEQRMSEQPASSPEGNESFYQAYVKVENRGEMPVRVDPEDFACAVGNSVVGIEPTWSGPAARSLLKNSSLDLLITFKAKAGYEPVLLYSPAWYDGTIRVRPASSETTTTNGP